MTTYQTWTPFKGNIQPQAVQQAFQAFEAFARSPNPNDPELYLPMIRLHLAAYAADNSAFPRKGCLWMEDEFSSNISAVFDTSPSHPTTDKRFFSVKPDCYHGETCLCYYNATSDGGIPNFPPEILRAGKMRKDYLKALHHLLVQFLIHLCDAVTGSNGGSGGGNFKFTDFQAERFQQTIRLANPEGNEFAVAAGYTDVEDWKRCSYMELDGDMQRILRPQSFLTNSKIPATTNFILALACVIARRILVLEVAYQGIGYMFARKDPLQYWDLTELADDSDVGGSDYDEDDDLDADAAAKHLRESAGGSAEQPRYPFRVINTHTLELEEDSSVFKDDYAILSHTWSRSGEVVYADLKDLLPRIRNEANLLNPNPSMKFTDPQKKLMGAIHAAKQLERTYIWLDNCCIDKANLEGQHVGEINESIPSMGDWYQNAIVCVVYLDDYSGSNLDDLAAEKTRWATRGWTLQEIVMSRQAVFYNKDWKRIGDTFERDEVSRILADICHIPENLLCCGAPPEVAASLVLQYASTRKTFKPEDRAYSVLGMLRVRIAPDYGEGFPRALGRLFMAVLQTTGDVSIFNWAGRTMQSPTPRRSLYPADFTAYKEIKVVEKPAYVKSPIRMDYIGLKARFDVFEIAEISVEKGNRGTLVMLRRLFNMLMKKGEKSKNDLLEEKVGTAVSLRLANKERIVTNVVHSIGAMIRLLEEEIKGIRPSKRRWVLARFAGLNPAAKWWLCELDYGEGSGETFGKRVAADEITQILVLEWEKDGGSMKQLDMWIT